MTFVLVKTVHVLGAVLFLGTGLGSAWTKFRADRSGEPVVVAWAQREVVRNDWLFTVPSGIVMPVTGLWLASLYGLPWTTGWVMLGIGCWALAGVCWVPAAYLQIRMRTLAEQALADQAPLPDAFHRANLVWTLLGVPAFVAAMVAVWVMIAKPAVLG